MNINKIKISVLACALTYSSLGLAFESISLEESVERAVLSNPEIGAQFQDFQSSLEGKNVALEAALAQAAKAGKDVARGRLSPTVELKAATGRDKNPNPNNPNYRDAQSSRVEIVGSYNLYRGGADSARIRQTAAQEEKHELATSRVRVAYMQQFQIGERSPLGRTQ